MYGIGHNSLDSMEGLIDPLRRKLPVQNFEAILMHAERYRRSADADQEWRRTASQCVDFFEGKQWKESDAKELEKQKRAALTINKVARLVNLVRGYQINNASVIHYTPSNDGSGVAEAAAALSHLSKSINEAEQLQYVDAEVHLDGLLGGRGYWDMRMDFSDNMYGKLVCKAVDPFSVYLDPEASEYDLNSGSFINTTKWISPDEVEFFYGRQAAALISPLASGMSFSQMPTSAFEGAEEISPWRTFGGDESRNNVWRMQSDQFYDWVDPYRKTVRMLDTQHYVRAWRWFFVDLETGDQSPVPDDYGPEKVQRTLTFCRDQLRQQLVVERKPTRRLRWTHMVGDIIVYDEWSPYDTFTITPYFPYFRRGKTRGMVEDLLDPQREINTRRSARINIIGRQSNGGWMIHKGSMTPQDEAKLDTDGSRPGFKLKYDTKNNTIPPPKQLELGSNPVGQSELEKEAETDIMEIAGINKSALGQVDQAVVSGRGILARQQQTVIGLEGMALSFHRSKDLLGKKQLALFQRHYTTERIVRVRGRNMGNPIEMIVNQVTAEGIKNNLSLGKYDVSVAEETLTESFLDGQFQELLRMKEMGMPIPDDWIIDASSIGRKEELRLAMQQMREAQAVAGVPPGDVGGAGPGGSATGSDGGSMPKGPEPGAPVPPAQALQGPGQ